MKLSKIWKIYLEGQIPLQTVPLGDVTPGRRGRWGSVPGVLCRPGGGASAFAFFMIEEIAPHDIFLTFDAAGLVGAGAGAGPAAGAGASAIESD